MKNTATKSATSQICKPLAFIGMTTINKIILLTGRFPKSQKRVGIIKKKQKMTKNKSRPILLLATGLLWADLAQAQESANASGGDATGSGGTVAYSI